MPVATPEQIDRVLQSVEYPAGRDAILEQARRRRAGQAVRSTLEQLPATKSYDSPAKARQQLERIEPGLKKGGGRRQKGNKASADEPAADEAGTQQLTLPEPVRQAADTVRIRAGRVIGEAGTQVADQADRGRGTLADGLMATARAIRQAGGQLEEGQPSAARIITAAADQLEGGAGYVQRTEVRQMLRQMDGVARRRPWLVLGVGAAAGFLATRLVRHTDMKQFTGQATGGSQASGRTSQTRASAGGQDAIALLEEDHATLRRLLRRGSSAAVAKRADVLKELKQTLQSHERMEEEVFYPALKENAATSRLVMDNTMEHQVVDEILGEIEQTDPSDPLWTDRFAAVRANLEHHAGEEETDLFPVVRQAFTRGELRQLGTRMSEIKELASQTAQA
jgi:hemerythrin superfamily protein/ElaB/YqjD/DUF883 family membrane-anchored ribosome-binding protein